MKKKQNTRSREFVSANIVLYYALFAALWIAVSDKLLAWLISDREWLTFLSIVKGFLFVTLTSFLLYLLLNLQHRKTANQQQQTSSRRLYWLFAFQILLMPLIPALLYGIHGQQIRDDSHNTLNTLAKVKAEQVETWLQERLADGLILQSDQAFSQAVALVNAGGHAADEAIRNPLELLARNKHYQSLLLLDQQNAPRFIVGHVPVHKTVIDAHSHLSLNSHHHQAGHGSLKTSWYWDENNRVYLDIQVPLIDTRNDKRIGTLIMSQDLQTNLLPLIQNWPGATSTGLIYLLQPHAEWLSYIALPANKADQTQATTRWFNTGSLSLLKQALSDPADIFEGKNAEATDVVASYIPVRYSGWHILVQQDRTEIYAPLYNLVYWITLVVFFAGLLVIFVVSLLWRQQQYTNQLELQRQTSEKDRLLKHFFELPLFGMAITHGQTGHWIRFNHQLSDLLGYSHSEMAEHTLLSLTANEYQEADIAAMYQMTQDLCDGYLCEKQLRRKDGQLIYVNIDTRCVRTADRNIAFIISVIEDISSQKENEAILRQSATVFDNTREGIMITDKNAQIIRVNPAFAELFGFSQHELQGKTPVIFKSGKHTHEFYQHIRDSLNTSAFWRGEIWNRRKDGHIIPLICSISAVRNDKQQLTHYVSVYSDISKLKASEAKLAHLAHHDPLTQLPNRTLLTINLSHAIDLAVRNHHRIALLMLDLDRFKDVNDSFGHQIGDALLQEVARRLRRRVRTSDTICRLGGDEFTVLIEGNPALHDVEHFAEDILQLLKDPFSLPNGREVIIGASIGISLYPEHGQTPKELLQQADAAMYRAKAHGRSCFRYFSDELTRAAEQRLDLEVRLQRALRLNELRLYFQPQIEISSNRIIGAEALVRWQDPAHGLISPAQFIPVAEETGLIKQLGEWVLLEACRQGKEWQQKGLPAINLAVNISPVQFRNSNILESVFNALKQTGYPASLLELELTESALMTHENEAVEILSALRKYGIRLAIDDFGTGYSSLAYLKRFPLDVLKIDKSFVDDIPHKKDDMEIAAAIVAMAHTLRLKVLAEGVETEEQLTFLKEQGCDCYQGYLMSPPVPADQFEQLLRAQAEDSEK
ncbi:MAG: EAL domain-containing protein [Gammaproteobacteria bacterium]|nr:EAL domain-containing protein [Gammaproteobacteria bacterium]